MVLNKIKKTKKNIKSIRNKNINSIVNNGEWKTIKFPKSEKSLWVPKNKNSLKSAVVKAHLKGNSWEKRIALLLDKYAIKNKNAVDIGAFIGTHTYTLSDAVNNGTVYTFEPQPWAYQCIKKTLAKNKIKNVKVFNNGVSDKKGTIEFCSDYTGGSSMCKERKKSYDWKSRYNIQIINLDSLNLKNISIMKIDVEGHENEVLHGAKKTILKNRPVIIIEIWKSKTKLNQFHEIMKEYNYKIEPITKTDYLCIPN